MSAIPSMQPLLQPLPLQTLPLECPFAWRSESYFLTRKINFFPEGSDFTISFAATRSSKILGYIPIIGSIIGISRIYNGIQESNLFNTIHLHILSNRSIQWITRGVLESLPVLGGILCMIIDAIATILNTRDHTLIRFADETPCGHCHVCGFCKC